MKSKMHTNILILLIVLGASCLAFSGCSSSGNGDEDENGDVAGFHALAANWLGTWEDTVFQVSGSLSIQITQDDSTLNATGTIGLGSLGLGNETGTGTGTIDGNNVTFTFNSSTVGSGSGTIGASNGSGSGAVTGALGYGPFTFSGTIDGNTISGTFDFTNPGGGEGTATIQKQ